MFHLFLRARPTREGGSSMQKTFRARTVERDRETDYNRVLNIMTAIETALSEAERERAGLSCRIEDVSARAAVTFGNGADEYLDREALDNHHHSLFEREIENGQRRLRELATSISHFKFLRAALVTRFSELGHWPPPRHAQTE